MNGDLGQSAPDHVAMAIIEEHGFAVENLNIAMGTLLNSDHVELQDAILVSCLPN